MNRNIRRLLGPFLALMLVLTIVPAASAEQDGDDMDSQRRSVSWEKVGWWWDAEARVGVSQLARSDHAITASYLAAGLTPGDVVTLWFVVFNNPKACSTSPCSVPQDVFNEDAQADFHWGDGVIVRPGGWALMRGTLRVGDVAYSGKAETGLGDPVALSAPRGAEVVLATHSHGPALSGADLEAQLSSFTGGCAVFNGPNGFAAGPMDIPDGIGECSTIQRSLHQ